jgi:TRAP transporter TAXI family solute receptor
VQLLMWFPYGQYHFTVRADSDIRRWTTSKGASVFLGPQGGGAYNAAKAWIEATTGLVAGEDYDAIKANWATGFQSFQDGKIDVYVNGCIDPCQQFIQFTETEDMRFIGPETTRARPSTSSSARTERWRKSQPGMYEGQKNDGPVMSNDTAVGIGVRADLDEETVYQITKAFWDNIDSVTSDAPWAKALSIDYAVKQLGTAQFHPGAARYYREAGKL